MQDKHSLLKRLEGLHVLLELEIFAFFVRPKRGWDSAVWAEHDDEALTGPRWAGQSQAWQTDEKWQRRCRKAEMFNELASVQGVHCCGRNIVIV